VATSKRASALPDRLLRLAQSLPSPVGDRVFFLLRSYYLARGRATGGLARIRFRDIELVAPLDHPAMFWRYLPKGFNRNFVLVAKETMRARKGLIVDVGANIGDGVALLRSESVDAPILAVEGAEAWFELLTRNTGGLADVYLEKTLLGEEHTANGLSLQVKDGSSKLVRAESSIQLNTLDDLVLRYQEMPVAMVKTDTDGFDVKVLLGAKSLLQTQAPVLFIEVDEGLLKDQGNGSCELTAYLRECGYTSVAVWDNYGRWLEARPLTSGIADLVARYPGGPDTAYLDIAAFAECDGNIMQAVVKASSTSLGTARTAGSS
jgi:FkbM family methyltransferase